LLQDYYSNYPETLPLRRPYSGNPGIIQELSCKKERKKNNEVKLMEN